MSATGKPFPACTPRGAGPPRAAMRRGQRLETLLARLLIDANLRGEFLEKPGRIAAHAGLDAIECDAMLALDRTGLTMAAASIAGQGRNTDAAPRVARRWLQALGIP